MTNFHKVIVLHNDLQKNMILEKKWDWIWGMTLCNRKQISFLLPYFLFPRLPPPHHSVIIEGDYLGGSDNMDKINIIMQLSP